MDDKKMLYLVRFDGYLNGYGSENYLLGVYSTREKAQEAVEKLNAEVKEARGENFWYIQSYIEEIELDFTYALRTDPDWEVATQVYLGGYIE